MSETPARYGPFEPPQKRMLPPHHCDTCRWWDRDSWFGGKEKDIDPGWGICERACRFSTDQFRTHAMALSGDGGIGELVTAPDFGCVQWERRA